MNKRRLLKLADLLEADAKNKKGVKFDLSDWGYAENKKKPISCGTTACAMGLAVASGAFKREGLRSTYGDGFLLPLHRDREGFSAAESLFDIGHDASTFLFSDSYYPRGKTKGAIGELFVAKRIRDFVAGKVKANSAAS